MTTDAEAVAALQEIWPRPRVGQRLKLRNGKVVEVITVRKARDVIRSMGEVEAMLMGPQKQALYGKHWLEVYYEAEVITPGIPRLMNVTPNDVEAILS